MSPGRVFVAGVLLFAGGLIGPFIISFFMGLFHMDEGTRYHALRFLFISGGVVSLCVGIPLVVLGLVWRRVRRPGASTSSHASD
ncbi:MAG TPA: hypothetical protein VF546_12815 [Pyrinomonadaceae bacterium]|jgi:MFS family permease